MHDFESEIFTECTNALHNVFPDLYVTGTYVNQVAKFPAVSIVQVDSATWRKTRDSSHGERHTTPTFEVNVYSNLKTGAKSQAKELLQIVDNLFTGWGFNRLMCSPIDNLSDNTIFRYTARYRGIIDENGCVYRR